MDAPATRGDTAALAASEMDRRSNRRSLLLCGAGALLGFVFAGLGLFTAMGTRTSRVPAEDAALVNGVPLLMADLNGQLQATFNKSLGDATPRQRNRILNDMIREELYVQRGVEMGLPNDDVDVRAALVNATEAQLAQDAMTSRPTDQELRAWYSSHVASYASEGLMTVGDYVARPGMDAAALAAKLRAGAAAVSLPLKPSGRMVNGEEFYFAARIHLGDRLFNVARQLRDGQVSDPVTMPDGEHIIAMIRNLPPVPTPYDEAKSAVLKDFLADKVRRLQDGNERFLRKRADIRVATALQ